MPLVPWWHASLIPTLWGGNRRIKIQGQFRTTGGPASTQMKINNKNKVQGLQRTAATEEAVIYRKCEGATPSKNGLPEGRSRGSVLQPGSPPVFS